MASEQRLHFGGGTCDSAALCEKRKHATGELTQLEDSKRHFKWRKIGVRECAPISDEWEILRAGVRKGRLKLWEFSS